MIWGHFQRDMNHSQGIDNLKAEGITLYKNVLFEVKRGVILPLLANPLA